MINTEVVADEDIPAVGVLQLFEEVLRDTVVDRVLDTKDIKLDKIRPKVRISGASI